MCNQRAAKRRARNPSVRVSARDRNPSAPRSAAPSPSARSADNVAQPGARARRRIESAPTSPPVWAGYPQWGGHA